MGIFNFWSRTGKKLLSAADDKSEAKSAKAIQAEIETLAPTISRKAKAAMLELG